MRAWRRPDRKEVLHYALLAAILALVVVVTYHPHDNPLTGREYPYPVHMDEYVHWGYAKAMVEQGEVMFVNPFTGGAQVEFDPEQHLHERGYHAFLGTYQGVTGVDWLDLFRYGPSVVAVFLALTVYALCRRWGAGLEGALLVACIPTTLRFLGPGFMVPIVFSLPFLVVGLHLLFHTRSWSALAAFSVIAAALWPIHVIGAFGLFALALLYGLFILASDIRRALVVITMAALPFLASWGFYARLLDTGVLQLPDLPSSQRLLLYFGILPLFAAVLGVGHLISRRSGTEFAAGAALGLGITLLEIVILTRLFFNVDPFILYDRSYMLLYVQATIAGGVGLAVARRWARERLERARWPTVRRAVPVLMPLAILLVSAGIVGASVKPQLEQPYYVVVTERQYEAYEDAAQRLNETYRIGMVQGIPTMPFSIVTGRPTVYVQFPSGNGIDPPWAAEFFANGANDTYLLIERGATVVATRAQVTNPDLMPIADGVYVLRHDYASRIARGLG